MKKLLYNLYATLEQADINHYEPDENAVIKFVDADGDEYSTTVGDIYRLISHIEENFDEGKDIDLGTGEKADIFEVVCAAQEYIDEYLSLRFGTNGIDPNSKNEVFVFRGLLAKVMYIEQ